MGTDRHKPVQQRNTSEERTHGTLVSTHHHQKKNDHPQMHTMRSTTTRLHLPLHTRQKELMPTPPRTCLTCGALHHNSSRCDTCQLQRDNQRTRNRNRKHYDYTYRKAAKVVRDNAKFCWICGEGARPDDPWQADHLIPADLHSPLAPAHRSCNARRGNRTT